MRHKLPPDFDADWYASTYPDVAMSGLNAREHYLRFGALLGRTATRPPPPPAQSTKVKAEPVAKAANQREVARESMPAAEQQPKPKQPKQVQPSPIIDRPEGFDPAATLPKTIPAIPDGKVGGPFSLEDLAALSAGSDSVNVTAALQAYAKLLGLKHVKGVANEQASVSCGAIAFQTGPTRIENAWFAGPSRLRLMLAGADESDPKSSGCLVRAYQALASAPAELRMLGDAVQLPSVGPVIHDLELVDPLMPLLLELTAGDGLTRAFTLLPFPSLLPGGLHGAELKALQTQPNPIDDFWALSDGLLQEAIGGENWPARSIIAISISAEPKPDHEPLLASLAEWLTCLFGVALNSEPGALKATPEGRHHGLQLQLPTGLCQRSAPLCRAASRASKARRSVLILSPKPPLTGPAGRLPFPPTSIPQPRYRCFGEATRRRRPPSLPRFHPFPWRSQFAHPLRFPSAGRMQPMPKNRARPVWDR